MLFTALRLHFLTNYNLTQRDTESFYKHFHDDYEIYVFLKGEAEYIVEDRVYSLRPYNLLILKPRRYHFAVIKSKDVYSRLIMNFGIEEDERTKRLLEPDFIDLNSYPESLALLKEVLHNHGKFPKEDFNEIIANTIKSVLILYNNLHSDLHPQYMTLNPYVRRALLYIDENIHSRITLKNIAEAQNINPQYFARIFKQALGESPISYVRKKQLLLARDMIEAGEYPTQVYYKCGFSDYSSFYRAYKGFFKNSPGNNKGKRVL